MSLYVLLSLLFIFSFLPSSLHYSLSFSLHASLSSSSPSSLYSSLHSSLTTQVSPLTSSSLPPFHPLSLVFSIPSWILPLPLHPSHQLSLTSFSISDFLPTFLRSLPSTLPSSCQCLPPYLPPSIPSPSFWLHSNSKVLILKSLQ